MKNEIAVLNKIRHQIAHCMAAYGDEPKELMYKLETLVIEWYEKGLQGMQGIDMRCPNCNELSTVYHQEWQALTCVSCKRDIEKDDWLIY